MTNRTLSISAMCTFDWTFEQDLALWSDVGVRHAGLLITKLANDADDRMCRLTEANIRASTLITEAFDLGDLESWEKTRSAHRAAIDIVARHNGRSIYFTAGRTTMTSWAEDLDRLAEAVAPTVAYACERGVIAAIEPTQRYRVSFVNTLRDAVDVAERTGVGLVVDFGNIWMERDLREMLARASPHIALVQIGDLTLSDGRAVGGRRAHVDDGELPLRRMMRDVLDAGYLGPFDLEVVGTDLAIRCDEAVLRRGIAAASGLLDEMGL